MIRLNVGSAANWNTLIDNALAYSIIVNSITYDNWYVASALESITLFGLGRTTNTMTDPITGVILSSVASGASDIYTATTNETTTTAVHNHQNLKIMRTDGKTLVCRGIYIFNATSLITAP
jgi:hypothetical protein